MTGRSLVRWSAPLVLLLGGCSSGSGGGSTAAGASTAPASTPSGGGTTGGATTNTGGSASGGGALPEGSVGIASRYPGDLGIASDPDVVFVEEFEELTLSDLKARWEDVKDNGTLSFSSDRPADSGGRQSLLVTHTGGQGTGGHLYRRLQPGERELYMRFYVKFDPDCHPMHHFVHMGGYDPPTAWPQGTAGYRPTGDDHFHTGLEPYGSSWRWDFYTYWMEMRSWENPDGSGTSNYGNAFMREDAAGNWAAAGPPVAMGRWICVEAMIKVNDPTTGRGGEQALWIDGQLWRMDGQIVSHLGPGFPRGSWLRDKWSPDPAGTPFEGFRWRSADGLDVNFVWLLVYITTAPAGKVSRVSFDHVVVARSYIGPLSR